MKKCKFHPYIDSYINKIETGEVVSSKEIKLAMKYVVVKLENPEVIIKSKMIDKAVELTEKYFGIKLLDWELFLFAIVHCYYESTDMVVFDEFFIMMGRGNGKNGFISPLAWYFTTHYHGIKGYNVDIIANNEDQAKTSFNDIYEVLEEAWDKLKKFYTKTKVLIINKKTKSYIKFNTSNAKTKDGKRSACLVFDEIHEYENYDTIKVFTSGFGKRKHSRTFYITTNGYVRGGVLDDQLNLAKDILNGTITDLGLLPLIYKIDEKEEYKNPDLWPKANPSLPYFPTLKKEMEKEFIKMKYQPHKAQDFLTKRMNFPAQDNFVVVAPWEKILATNQEIPFEEIKGMNCIGSIDYARTTDFASVGLLFKLKNKRIFIEHSFVCHTALEIESRQIKFPVKEMEKRGLITIIKRDAISAENIAMWFLDMARTYNIQGIVCDSYRASLLESKFTELGLPLKQIRSGPITHAKVAPLIENIFSEEILILGDNPTMRWYINNTCVEIDKKGNTTYLKIEPQLRKTDGFFSLIHALTQDDQLIQVSDNIIEYDVHVY